MPTAADRWTVRRTRRLVREAARLAEEVNRFGAQVERFPGPYAEEARSLVAKSVDLLRLAAKVDGMRDATETTTEEA